jgi:endo-1,4-beta-D-glucanase Y
MRFFLLILAFALCAPFTAVAVLEIPNTQPKVDAEFWKKALDSTWQGMIKRNITPYGTGLIHRPKSETPGDAVSEAVGYGLLLALYADDQKTFDGILQASIDKQLGACQNWRLQLGGGLEPGSATDADEDIALALVFADELMQKGLWENTGKDYASKGKSAIDCVRGSISGQNLLWPGNNWQPGYNAGYFAPAWYRIFAQIDKDNEAKWLAMVDATYDFLANGKNPGYPYGMVPDWSQTDGTPGGGGYNTYLDGKAFFKDAIRILWRVANDHLWFPNDKAKQFLTNALTFINSKGGAEAANFYQLDGSALGELVPIELWEDMNAGNTPRIRREHSHLTIGQWATAAVAVGTDKDKLAFSAELKKFYEGGDYWGKAVDPNPTYIASVAYAEDTLHNEMYFDQFLAWFGASMMSGTWNNVIDNLEYPKDDDPGIVTPTPIRNHPAPSGHLSEGGEFFDVRGNRVAGIPKTPGVYIVRQGSQTKTMVVK